jgi:ribonuclease VapC
MFVDAAAIIAILADEPEARRCSEALVRAESSFTSPIAVWEAVMALARADKFDIAVDVSAALVTRFLEERAISVRDLPPNREAMRLSLEAASRFRNKAIRLNLADCFHYACAKYYVASILSTAEEFRSTDLEIVP